MEGKEPVRCGSGTPPVIVQSRTPPDGPSCESHPWPLDLPQKLPAFVDAPKSYEECWMRGELPGRFVGTRLQAEAAKRFATDTGICRKLLREPRPPPTEAERVQHWVAQVDLALHFEWPLSSVLLPGTRIISGDTLELKDPGLALQVWEKTKALVADRRHLGWDVRWRLTRSLFPRLLTRGVNVPMPRDDSDLIFTTERPAKPTPVPPEKLDKIDDPLRTNGGFRALSIAEKRELLALAAEYRQFFVLREVFMRPELTPEPEIRELARKTYEEVRAAGFGREPVQCPSTSGSTGGPPVSE